MRVPIDLEKPHAAGIPGGGVQVGFPFGNGNRPVLEMVGENLTDNGGGLLHRVPLGRCLQMQTRGDGGFRGGRFWQANHITY